MKMTKRVKMFTNAVFLAISVGILVYFCVENNNLLVLLQSLKNANYFYLFCTIICLLTNSFLDCVLFWVIFNKILKIKYSWWDSFSLTMLGQFYGAITPFQAGTQPSQIVKLSQKGVSSGTATSVIIKKFLVSQTAVVIFSTIFVILKANLFLRDVPLFFPFLALGFVFQCFPIFLLSVFYINKNFTLKTVDFVSNLAHRLHLTKEKGTLKEKLTAEIELFTKSNEQLKCGFKLNLLLHVVPAVGFVAINLIPFFVYKTLMGSGFPMISLLATQIFITIASGITPLPGGGGASEGGFLVLFGRFFSKSLLTPAMILSRFIAHYLYIIFGAFFLFDEKKSA